MACTEQPKFPVREVITLTICVTTTYYTLVNLFPYVGVMVKDIMELDSINEAGKGCQDENLDKLSGLLKIFLYVRTLENTNVTFLTSKHVNRYQQAPRFCANNDMPMY